MSEEVPEQHPDEVIAATRAVTETLDKINGNLSKIEKYGRRTRSITLSLILSLVLDLALTITIAVVTNSEVMQTNALHNVTNNEISQTNALHNVQIADCRNANVIRAEQIQLWNFFIALAQSNPAPNRTATEVQREQREVATLLKYVDKTFAPQKCS